MDSSQSAATAGTAGGGNGTMTSQASAMVATTVVDDPKKNLNQVTNSIQKVLGLLHQLYLTVSSFNASSQLPLLQCLYRSTSLFITIYSFVRYLLFCFSKNLISLGRFCSNSLVLELDNMVKLAEKCNIQVPMELLKWVCCKFAMIASSKQILLYDLFHDFPCFLIADTVLLLLVWLMMEKIQMSSQGMS